MDEVSGNLAAIFQNVNEWLKFAEAKNAVLLAFAGAGITATVTILATLQNSPNSVQIGLLATTALLCICALVCAFSFLPKTNLERLLWKQTKPSINSRYQGKDTDNFYYFGHLQKYTSTGLLDALNKHYFEEKLAKPYNKQYEDVASQITINALIASLKFEIFTYGLYTLIFSILALPCSILISLIIYRKI